MNVTDKARVEALQGQLTKQAKAIQSGEDRRQMLDFAVRPLARHADRSRSRDIAIKASVPDIAIGA